MANQIRYQVGFDVKQTNLNQLKTSLQELQKMKISDIMKINETDISSARTALKSIQQDASAVESALNKAFNTKLNTINIESFNRELSASNLTIERVYQSFKRAGASGEAAFRSLTSQILSTNIQLKQSHVWLDKMATTLTNTIKWNAASAAVNGLSRSVEQAWGYVKSLDTSLNNIRVVTGKSADEMANFAVQANNAAKELGKTTTDYTNAALIYAQQGLNDKEIAERAAITLKTANVTGQSTDAVSEQLTAVWNGYKVNAEEAQLYVDRLAAVAATTASDLEELSTGMSKVASAAAAMGVGEDQLAAQLSTIISVTKQAPESVGTALRTVYARISDIKAGIDQDGVTLGNYSGKMAELGFNVLDATGNLRDMGEVMEEIGGRWGDLTRQQQIYLAQTMAGQRQYNNLLALFDNFEQYNKALNTAQNAAGTLQEQQDIYMESTAAHLQVLKASVEDIYDSFADTDSINGLIDGLSEAATFTAKLVDSLGGGKTILSSLGTLGFSVFSQQIANGIQTTINNLESARNQAQQFKNAIQQAQELQDKGLGNDYTKFLIGEQANLLNIGSRLPVNDFNAIQENLQKMSQTSGEIDILEEKIDLLGKSFNSLGTDIDQTSAQWGTLDDMLSSADGVEAVKNALNNLKENFNPVLEKQQQMRDAFKTMYVDIQNSSPQAEQSFNNLKTSITGLIDSLKTTNLGNSTDSLFSILPEGAKKSVLQAQFELQQLDFSQIGNPQQASSKITQIFASLNQTITNEINSIQQLIKSADAGDLENLQEKLRNLLNLQKQLEDGYEVLKERSGNLISMQQFTSIASGVAQVGSAIRQIQNLGSIWKNADLNTGEKILQTVTNLAISLPMLITGFSKLIQSMDLVSISAETVQGKIRLLNTSLQVNPWFLIVTAILAAVTALGAYVNAVEKAREARIKQNQSIIDQENKYQEEIKSTQNLLSALQQLDEERKNGQLTRSEVKSSIEDLIKQYGLEGQAADDLAHSYSNLAEYIHRARQEAVEEAKDSARRELQSAKTVVTTTALQQGKEGHIVGSGDYSDTAKYSQSQFMGGVRVPTDNEALIQLFKENGLINDQGIFSIRLDTENAEEVLSTYESLEQILNQIDALQKNGEITEEQKNSSQLYTTVSNLLKTLEPAIQAYKTAKDDFDKADIDFAIEELVEKDIINFSSQIKSVNDYIQQRAKLIAQLRSNEDFNELSDEQIEQKANAWLSDRYRTLYNQYSEAADFIEKIRKDFGGENSLVEGMIGQLDQQHFDALMDFLELHPSVLTDWDSLKDIISDIANIDLSNVQNIALPQSVEDIRTSASDQYNIYQSLQDQVSGGKTISKKEMESLEPEVQEFFSMMANGSYKMTGDAKEFYETINNLKLDGFYQTINAIEEQQTRLKELQNHNFNYDNLDQEAYKTEFMRGYGQVSIPDYDLAQQQLDYLNAVSSGNSEMETAIQLWQKQIDEQKLSKDSIEEIAQAIANVGDQTGNVKDRVEELKKMGEEVQHQLHDAMFPTDSDIDTDTLESLSKTIQNIAENSDELADGLSEDTRAAEDVAEAILRFDNAVEDVVDNYEDWMDALNSGSIQEQAEVIDDLRDAYADLLDLDGSSLSEDFLTSTENLDLMKAAIDGDIDAYNELLSLAQQDIVAHLHLSEEDYNQFLAEVNNIQAMMDEMNFQDIEIGASLDDTDFINGLENMINAAGMTAQQATDYLASMGVDAEVIEQKNQGTETKSQTGWSANLVGHTEWGQVPLVSGQGMNVTTSSIKVPYTAYDLGYEPTTETVTDTKENSAFSLKVTSANKSSGGNFKFTQSKNGGGSKGNSRRSGGGGGGSKGRGGSGGGGKGTTQEADKSQKDAKKAMEDTRDIYHDINIELQQIDRRLDRVQKKQDRLYGKQLLDNLNKQSKILDQHKSKLEEKHRLQEQDLQSQQKVLKNLGVTFDEYGNISNYMSILASKQEQVNKKTLEYNNLIAAYNQSTNKDVKKAIADEAEKLNKQIQEYENEYKALEDKIKNYDDLREDMEDLVDEIEEETQQQIEINIKKFRMDVELRLDMGEAERDWNNFRREVLEHTDVLKGTDFQEIFSDATRNVRDITSYFNIRGNKGSLQTLTDQLIDTRAQIESIDRTGTSAIYGDNKAQAMEDLQSDLDKLMDQMQDIQGLIDDIDEAYLDTVDDIEKQFDKQIEDYEYVGELIQHDIDLLSLLYGDRNYDAMNKYYSTLEKNNLKQLDSLKQQRDFWKEQWDAAVARGDSQAAKQFEQNYKNTIKNLNETVENAAKNIQDKYINAIDKIFNELDKKISNGRGTDYLSTQWQLMNKNADEYLDTINTAFAIQETERKYQKALDETKSLKNQQALRNLMDEQLNILRNKEKVTQYDVERAEKLLQVEQARIALQDAQSAKTSMRLKRDSQGNYSYEYVADNGAVGEAQANLAQAQNDLYNFDKERYQSNLDDMLSAWRDFQSEYKDILEDTSLLEEERIERLSLLREEYGEYINDKTTENLVVRNNLMESAFADLAAMYSTDVQNYNQMSIDEQNILMGDLVPAWESGIQQMSDKVAGEGGFIPTCESAFNDLADATKQYKNELDDMAQTAGYDLQDVKDGVDDLAYSFEDLIEDNSELTNRMYEEIDAITSLRAEAHALVTEYKAVYDAAKLAVSGIHSFIQAQQAQTAAETAAAKGNGSVGSSGSGSSGSGSNGGSSGSKSGSNSGSGTGSASKAGSSKGGNGSDPSAQTIEGIAGNIWIYGTWGDDPDRHNNMIAKFGKTQGDKIYKAVQAKFNSGYGYNGGLEHDWEYYKKFSLSSFRSGGYTGTWIGDAGKLAILHQKEMVLNQEDTKNLLDSVNIMRSVMSTLNGNMSARLGEIKTGYARIMSGSGDGIEQNVHIEASFPNVDSKREIEEAFNDLVNLAAQRAMRR